MFFDKVEPRICLLSLLLISAITAVSSSVPSLGLGGGFVLLCLLLSQIPLRVVLYRLATIQGTLAAVLLTVPLTVDGVAAFEGWGVTVSQEGLKLAALILVKSTLITGLTVALLGQWNAPTLIKTLSGLGLSPRLGLMFGLLVRSISILTADLHRIYAALRARRFEMSRSFYTLSRLGVIVEALMIRTTRRIRMTAMALRCRGYGVGGDVPWRWSVETVIFSCLTLGCGAGMVL